MMHAILAQTQASAAPISVPALHWLDYVMVIGYLVATAGIVAWASRRQSNSESFFLGNRRMPWLAVGLSIMATLLSSISYLGLTGELIKHGISAFAMYLAWPMAILFVIPVIVPFFMKLRLTNAYSYLELRFNPAARRLGSGLFFFLRLGWISMVMYAGSLALSSMSGWDLKTVIIAMGLAAAIYSFFGGLESVIWTDVLQAIMLFGGALMIVVHVWWTTDQGPLGWWATATSVDTQHTQPILFSWDPRVPRTIVTIVLNGFFWQICTHTSDQVVLQRYSSTPSVQAARRSYLVNMGSSFCIGLLLGLAGLALLHYYTLNPDRLQGDLTPRETGDKLMPYFYSHELPIGCAGLILANFLCDAMQTLVAGVNSIAAVATSGLGGDANGPPAEPFDNSRTTPTQSRQLLLARVTSLGLSLVCVAIALGIVHFSDRYKMNIVELMPRAFNLFLGPLASMFMVGMFLPRVTGRAVLPATGLALAVSIVWSYWGPITGTGVVLSHNWAIILPCLAGIVFSFLLSLLIDSNSDHSGRQYTWRRVMARESITPTP